jgi:hypothetical protein
VLFEDAPARLMQHAASLRRSKYTDLSTLQLTSKSAAAGV